MLADVERFEPFVYLFNRQLRLKLRHFVVQLLELLLLVHLVLLDEVLLPGEGKGLAFGLVATLGVLVYVTSILRPYVVHFLQCHVRQIAMFDRTFRTRSLFHSSSLIFDNFSLVAVGDDVFLFDLTAWSVSQRLELVHLLFFGGPVDHRHVLTVILWLLSFV